MAALADLPPLREVIASHGLLADKRLGQHFLLDLNLTRKIARQAGDIAGQPVLEVGPGPGGLTRALVEAGANVVAVEKDRRCLQVLAELAAAAQGHLQVVPGDALKVDEATLFDRPATVIANLPYNISTVLLTRWLDRLPLFRLFVLMFQKEVAQRITAPPGSSAYGRLSVYVQWLCEVELLFDIPARAFTPPPKVVSSLIRLTPRASPLALADSRDLQTVTAAAFGQRRKMLRSSLRQLGPEAESWLRAADIDPTARAETLSVEAFCALTRAYRAGIDAR